MNLDVRPQTPPDRRTRRRVATRYLRVYSPVPGTVVDLHTDGVCLETVARLRTGVEYQFRVRQGSILFTLRGTVRWHRYHSSLASSSGKELELFRSGIEFRRPLPAETFEFLKAEASGS